MKRLIVLLLLLAALFTLAGCGGGGDTDRVRLEIQNAGDFDPGDIRDAMNTAMKAFRRDCDGCSLLRLRFDALYSESWITASGGEADGTVLVLLANYLDEDGTEHTGQPWQLVKNGNKWSAQPLF